MVPSPNQAVPSAASVEDEPQTPGAASGTLQNGNATLPAAGAPKSAAPKAARDADGHGTLSPSL